MLQAVTMCSFFYTLEIKEETSRLHKGGRKQFGDGISGQLRYVLSGVVMVYFKGVLTKKKQDGGVGRHTAPPRTTKRRTTTI